MVASKYEFAMQLLAKMAAENIARRFYQIDAFGTTEKTARFRLPFAVGLCYNHWAWTREEKHVRQQSLSQDRFLERLGGLAPRRRRQIWRNRRNRITCRHVAGAGHQTGWRQRHAPDLRRRAWRGYGCARTLSG